MAGERFVPITREEFEQWLNGFAKKAPYKGWKRYGSTAGSYIVKFSDYVGCLITTTLTKGDEVKGVGEASTKMRLVAVEDGRLLNKKASPQRYYRTKGWAKTWKEKGVDWWYKDIYLASQDFYEDKASIPDVGAHVEEWTNNIKSIPEWEKDPFLKKQMEALSKGWTISKKVRDSIERMMSRPSRSSRPAPEELGDGETSNPGQAALPEWMTKIESIEGWRDNSFLKTMHDKARRGFPLTDRMQEGIEKFLLNEKSRTRPQADPPGSSLTTEQRAFVERMRAMKDLAGKAKDDWTVGFLNTLITRAERGQSFSDRQKEILRDKMRVYNTGRRAALRVARAFLRQYR